MDSLEQLTNQYASSQGSGTFNKHPDPAMTRFDEHEGGDILKVYGHHDPGFGSPIGGDLYMDDYYQEGNQKFGIERQRQNYQKATKFINNDMPPRPYTGGNMRDDTASFDKYSHRGRDNEGFEDILDSLKGDTYERRDDPQRRRPDVPPLARPYTGPDQYSRGYRDDRSGPISVGTRSIPDLDRSQVSLRDEDIRSIQPMNLGMGGGPSWSKPGSFGNRGVSTGEEKRRSHYRNDQTHTGGGIDVIDTSASRRQKTAEPRGQRRDNVDAQKFYGRGHSGPEFGGSGIDRGARPPLHKHVSMINEDDRLSQYRDRGEGPRSGRFRQDDKDNASDITSRRRGIDQTDSFKQEGGIPALDTSVSRRSGRYVQAKTPGFHRNEDDTFAGRRVRFSNLIL
jgi:hypothetical protein